MSLIPLKIPNPTACMPSGIWNSPAIISKMEAISITAKSLTYNWGNKFLKIIGDTPPDPTLGNHA